MAGDLHCAEVKNEWSYTFSPLCHRDIGMDKFTFICSCHNIHNYKVRSTCCSLRMYSILLG